MSILKQPDGRFEVRLTFTDVFGKRKETRKRNIANVTLAKRWEREAIKKHADDNFTPSSNTTLNEAMKLWLDTYKAKVKPSTYRKVVHFIDNHILTKQWFDNVRIADITTINLQRFLNHISSINVNYRKNISPFKQTMQMAVSFQVIENNPFDRVVYPKAKPAPIYLDRVDFYNKEQLERFLETTYELFAKDKFQIYALFRLLAFSGMRRGELLALKWDDLNFSNGEIRINKALSDDIDGRIILSSPKSKASKRIVKIDGTTLSILRTLQSIQAEKLLKHGLSSAGYIFTADNLQDHVNLVKPRKWAETIIRESGLPKIKIHGFRHTYATLAVQAGMNVKQLQYQLGHEDVQTTLQVYAAVTQDMKDTTADIFTSLVNF
jgi:integrase